jgi:hypothetical protein
MQKLVSNLKLFCHFAWADVVGIFLPKHREVHEIFFVWRKMKEMWAPSALTTTQQ